MMDINYVWEGDDRYLQVIIFLNGMIINNCVRVYVYMILAKIIDNNGRFNCYLY